MKKIFYCIPFFLLAQSVSGQTIPGPLGDNSFMDLTQKRAKLNSDIPYLSDQIANIKVIDTSNIHRQVGEAARKHAEILSAFYKLGPKAPGRVGDSVQNLLEGLSSRMSELNDSLAQAKANWIQKQQLSERLDSAQRALSQVEFQINQIMIPKISQQNFLFWSTIAFVVLMGLLLFIFLRVISSDRRVRLAVFGSDSGLQFVTLFSIVIAIILFGLTGILEGKELSALLGSVAGYILGKAKFAGDGAKEPSETNPQHDLVAGQVRGDVKPEGSETQPPA